MKFKLLIPFLVFCAFLTTSWASDNKSSPLPAASQSRRYAGKYDSKEIIKKLGFLTPVRKSNEPGEELLDYALLIALSDKENAAIELPLSDLNSNLEVIRKGYEKIGAVDKAKKLKGVIPEFEQYEAYVNYTCSPSGDIWVGHVLPLIQSGKIDVAKSEKFLYPFDLVLIARHLELSGRTQEAQELAKNIIAMKQDSNKKKDPCWEFTDVVEAFCNILLGSYEQAYGLLLRADYSVRSRNMYDRSMNIIMPEILSALEQRNKLGEALTALGSSDFIMTTATTFFWKQGDKPRAVLSFQKSSERAGIQKILSVEEDANFWSMAVKYWVDDREMVESLIAEHTVGSSLAILSGTDGDRSVIARSYLELGQRQKAFAFIDRMSSPQSVTTGLVQAADIDYRSKQVFNDRDRIALNIMVNRFKK
jgi:tetratricopeptide (TPR) repeat protein